MSLNGSSHPLRTITARFTNTFSKFLNDESGQDLIEYALVAAIIALGAVVSMTALANGIKNAFTTVGTKLINSV